MAGPASAAPADAPSRAGDDPWVDVAGQEAAVRQLTAAAESPVHAYLLIGPPGSGKRELARAFAGLLLATAAPASADDRARHLRLARAEQHPDLRVVDPEGNTFRKGDAERVVRSATLAPVEGARKVVVASGCEDMEDEAAGLLLKTVEEPPVSTVFVLLATEIVPELVTIASRCVRIEVPALPAAVVAGRLVAEGVEPDRAATAAAAAAGDLERARTLATDDRLALRHQAWRDVPYRLDGTGHRAATVVAELQSMIGEALGPLHERQAAEAAALDEQIERFGLRGSGRKDLETRHKREVRRFRTAELRFGLATLAAAYRDAIARVGARRDLVGATLRIDAAAVSLQRYPNETLLLQALVAHLPPVPRPTEG
ncbi:MAG TPA: ATP-binding protein [Acidimicrobiales bacterium]|nr:ATP-binding protein [Acidimicrobiales bacterium]